MCHYNPKPEDFQHPERLGVERLWKRHLYLQGDEVTAWKGHFYRVPHLQSLQLKWSASTHAPEDIQDLRHLRSLNILNVDLHEFPSWICKMTKLRRLMVRGTYITHIPDEISNLVNLRYLELGNNLLTRFDADLRGCHRLSSLFLSDNDLQGLPSKLPPKTNLGLAGTPFRAYSGHSFEDIPPF